MSDFGPKPVWESPQMIFDFDGDIDLLVTNFENEHNTLYDQTSPGVWEDRSRVADIVQSSFSSLGFGVAAVDLDNDSYQELVIGNGHVHHNAVSGYAQHSQVLRRARSGKYAPVSQSGLGDYFRDRHVARALWCLDFDRDHLLDLVVTHQRESTALLHNETPEVEKNGWIRIRLVGTKSARGAVGSVVSVSYGELQRTAPVVAGHGFFCTSDETLHFGLGASNDAGDVQIEVRWPDGNSQTFQVSANQDCLIVEGDEKAFIFSANNR